VDFLVLIVLDLGSYTWSKILSCRISILVGYVVWNVADVVFILCHEREDMRRRRKRLCFSIPLG
jgi:hypothetical protein